MNAIASGLVGLAVGVVIVLILHACVMAKIRREAREHQRRILAMFDAQVANWHIPDEKGEVPKR